MRLVHALGVGCFIALWIAAGCGSSSKDKGSSGAGGIAGEAGSTNGETGGEGNGGPKGNTGGTPPIECGTPGSPCEQGSDCCSGLCAPAAASLGDGGNGGSPGSTPMVCVRSSSECLTAGFACSSNLDCCNGNCANGHCSESACIEDNQPCSADGEACCSGECVDGVCADINGDRSCKVSGNSCESDGECCSKLCLDGKCFAKSSYCIQSGDVCTEDTDCCEGVCDKSFGSTYGYCRRPTVTSDCNANELLAGEVCDNDCKKCCSRSCAPNHLGVFVCQLSGGCRPSGEICTKDTDCCGGSALEGLPGNMSNQPAKCVKQNPDDVFGQCRKGGGCTPRGDTCKYDLTEGTACGDPSSSKPSNCCPLGDTIHGECSLDALLVPRCGADDACRQPGETCASSADCCDQHPCVPDEEGVLRCGSNECIEDSGSCTVDADCCVGTLCVIPPGAVTGTCTTVDPPDGSGGSPGSGGSSSSGGAPGSGGSGNDCVPYGQTCQESSDCCNSLPCISNRCLVIR